MAGIKQSFILIILKPVNFFIRIGNQALLKRLAIFPTAVLSIVRKRRGDGKRERERDWHLIVVHSVVSDSLRPHGQQHASLPCLPSLSPSLLKLMSIEPKMPSNHLILCRPLLLLPSIYPSIRVFSNELTLNTINLYLYYNCIKYYFMLNTKNISIIVCTIVYFFKINSLSTIGKL